MAEAEAAAASLREDPSVGRGLAALHAWLCDFPQLAAHRPTGDADLDADAGSFDRPEVAIQIRAIAQEICARDGAAPRAIPPSTTVTQAWTAVHDLVREAGLAGDECEGPGVDVATRDGRYRVLCALLCHALSDRCDRRTEYVERIMASCRPDVQQEIMRIIQEHAARGDGDDASVSGDYSTLLDRSLSSTDAAGASFECESDGDTKRDRSAAFGEDLFDPDTPRSKKSHQSDGDDGDSDGHQSEDSDGGDDEEVAGRSMAEEELRAALSEMQQQLQESRRREADLTMKLDEEQSQHRARMLQTESQHLQAVRDLEERTARETSEQKRELEALRDREQRAKDLEEENARLRDDLDVLECSKEKLQYTEEQLRKCRERIELVGDAHAALQREERAHAGALDRCLVLETELAQLKPLKRQLEEYRVRATDAAAKLAECREDLRRAKERSSGLEGANLALTRGAGRQRTEADDLQRRLQAQGGDGGGGTAVGIGMSELNPELMKELKMLRSEYARLRAFEAKREVDAVQRLEESYDDAKRLSERFKDKFFQTKSELEDTTQLLRESEKREAALKEEVEDWSQRHKELGVEMKEERLKSHKAALDAERSFQDQKKCLISKGREELQALEQKLTLKIEAERKQHKERMDRAEQQRTKIEDNLTEQLTALREHSCKTLRAAKDQEQTKIDELEQSKRAELEKLEGEKAKEVEALMIRGKGMVRQERQKNKELKRQITEEYEVKISALQANLDAVTSHQEDYEKKVLAKIAKRDVKIRELDAKNREAVREKEELENKVRRAESHSKDLAGEMDRLRRQLSSRFGPGGASQSTFDDLTSMCKSLREENRRLKQASHPDRLLLTEDVPKTIAGKGDPTNAPSSLNKASLTQFREEYEEKIKGMEEKTRDLIMKNSASTAETQKAEQRAWKLEEELTKVKTELTTAKLALQRNERRSDFSTGLRLGSGSKKGEWADHKEKENTPNDQIRRPPSGRKREDFAPKFSAPKSKEKKASQTPPTLMELTQKNDGNETGGAPQECNQQ